MIAGMKVDIPKLLDALMDREGLTQAELAVRLSEKGRNGIKITQPYISKWKKGHMPEGQYYARILEVAKELGALSDETNSKNFDTVPEREPEPQDGGISGVIFWTERPFLPERF